MEDAVVTKDYIGLESEVCFACLYIEVWDRIIMAHTNGILSLWDGTLMTKLDSVVIPLDKASESEDIAFSTKHELVISLFEWKIDIRKMTPQALSKQPIKTLVSLVSINAILILDHLDSFLIGSNKIDKWSFETLKATEIIDTGSEDPIAEMIYIKKFNQLVVTTFGPNILFYDLKKKRMSRKAHFRNDHWANVIDFVEDQNLLITSVSLSKIGIFYYNGKTFRAIKTIVIGEVKWLGSRILINKYYLLISKRLDNVDLVNIKNGRTIKSITVGNGEVDTLEYISSIEQILAISLDRA